MGAENLLYIAKAWHQLTIMCSVCNHGQWMNVASIGFCIKMLNCSWLFYLGVQCQWDYRMKVRRFLNRMLHVWKILICHAHNYIDHTHQYNEECWNYSSFIIFCRSMGVHKKGTNDSQDPSCMKMASITPLDLHVAIYIRTYVLYYTHT